MTRPRLPEGFSLMNRDYVVRRATPSELDQADGRLYGLCDFEEAEIVIFPHGNRDNLEHTYFHELAHALLMTIGQPKLAKDEAVVDQLGAALHQYEKTMGGRFTLRERKNANTENKSDKKR